MAPVRIGSYLKSVMRYTFLILDTYHPDGDRGSAVDKALRYKSKGRWFDSRWCHRNFSLT